MQYNFEWDPAKARSNAVKHGVTFEQATSVFADSMALTIFDESHSNEHEQRWITLGQSNGQVYLVVVHTYQDQKDNTVTIRIISARPATKHEIKQYEG
ncbi:BrnT family toxin [Porticoccus sp. W117]|uniref:BrnT family toxin n=1 Tax=Porticoccus sp. W117 TaxID=3054777 RepID=UPI002599C0D0|nr:BrnT family toxin [Porticoccus sp. W117]MDM3871168.1 BrnT family toxin [Porticoccus sp. W117]